jgi:hypothetical protein
MITPTKIIINSLIIANSKKAENRKIDKKNVCIEMELT